MVEISLSGSGEGPGASKRPGLLDGGIFAAREGHEGYEYLLWVTSVPTARANKRGTTTRIGCR
jgi:hypothetical protein